jgi:hypothetical protein
MNIYYENPRFAKLPNELQNKICSYLPPHPIVKEIKEYNKNYYEDNFLNRVTFKYHIKMINYDNMDIDIEVFDGYTYVGLISKFLQLKNTDKYKDLDFHESNHLFFKEWFESNEDIYFP